jgi:diguanylate cyclase (GGDEF)-like protein
MLETIYGPTQNYSKSPFEVHSHLTEVCGVFGKHLFKCGDIATARRFVPKIFAWAVALLKKMHPGQTDLEGMILRKFPGVCSYCGEKPCVCWKGEKPSLDAERLRSLFYRNANSIRRSVNDFQLLFRGIYEQSWFGEGKSDDPQKFRAMMRMPYLRMIEELAEIAEAVRFHHLYPENFENELADFFAWWFAVATCMNAHPDSESMLAEQMLWAAYPGHCLDCQSIPCFCRPGPVRELISKPPPGYDHRYDALTSVYNQAAYNEDINHIAANDMPIRLPLGCVRVDIDDFKKVNGKYGHPAGDAAIQHIASVLRKHARERDRVYRISGDEFGIIFMDYTEEEASGAMKRVCQFLEKTLVRWVSAGGKIFEFPVSVSVGVAECQSPRDIERAFENADQASYASKRAGKARVTRATKAHVPLDPQGGRGEIPGGSG